MRTCTILMLFYVWFVVLGAPGRSQRGDSAYSIYIYIYIWSSGGISVRFVRTKGHETRPATQQMESGVTHAQHHSADVARRFY